MVPLPYKYLDIENLQTGDIILFHTCFKLFQPVTWLAALIRFFENNYWNHVGIIVVSSPDKYLIYEALAKGVEKSELFDNLRMKEIKIKRLNSLTFLKPYNAQIIADKCNAAEGLKYDYSSCFFFQLIRQMGEKINPELDIWIGRKNKMAAKRFYCSELAAWCLNLNRWYKYAPDDLDNSTQFHDIFIGKVSISR